MQNNEFKFSDDFIWGTATSAHQTEGNNTNSDWWQFENSDTKNATIKVEPSGEACDSYNRYKEDFDIAKKYNTNAIRISIEWARIEPKEGKFDKKEIEHYKEVLKYAKSIGLKTYVTLHHFTNPVWFSNLGGWTNSKSKDYFSRYCKKCAVELDEYIDTYFTINEPQVYTLMSYFLGIWPPNKKNYWYSFWVQINFGKAHKKAYEQIKQVSYKPVGIVKNIVWYEAHTKNNKIKRFFETILSKILYFMNSTFFLKQIINKTDIIGLNYYVTNIIKGFGINNPNAFVSDLNWWIDPIGLEKVLLDLKKYNKDIYITENGLADAKDRIRADFIKVMLTSCANAIEKAVPLKGYFHWSLLDNYEWHHGFWPRFGLIAIDRDDNFKRTPRKSFEVYSKICKENKIKKQKIG